MSGDRSLWLSRRGSIALLAGLVVSGLADVPMRTDDDEAMYAAMVFSMHIPA